MRAQRLLAAVFAQGPDSGAARALLDLLEELERWYLEEDERSRPVLPGDLEPAFERAMLWL